MVVILDGVSTRPGGMLILGNLGSDKVMEIPSYQCKHCGRTIFMRADRTRPRHTCKQCGGRVCDLCGVQECNVFERDVERAYRDKGGQPWLLRHNGEPVDRLFLPDGSSKLVLRKDHNLTLAERTRSRRNDAQM